MIKKLIAMIALVVSLTACGANGEKNDTSKDSTSKPVKMTDVKPTTDKYVEIATTEGNITVRLYGDTPRHQANFLKLVKEGYYDNVLFHRVINEFMVQTGDPDSKTAKAGQQLGSGGPGYQIDAEIVYPRHFHKRGALAAARTGDAMNPERKSSGSQFYIVTGRKVSEPEMAQVEQQFAFQEKQEAFNKLAQQNMDSIRAMQMRGDRNGLMALQQKLIDQVEAQFKDKPAAQLPAEIRQAYTTVGGTPHLDNQYTVFGEVVKGMDVVAKIEKAETDNSDRPKADIRIKSMKVVDAPKK